MTLSQFSFWWMIFWVAMCPIAFVSAFLYGRRWKAKNYVLGLMTHLRRKK